MAHQWTEYDEFPCISQESDNQISMEPFSEKVARSHRCLLVSIELMEQIPSAVTYKQHSENLPMLDDYLKYAYHFFFCFCVKYSICHEESRAYSIEGDLQTKCTFGWGNFLKCLKSSELAFTSFLP